MRCEAAVRRDPLFPDRLMSLDLSMPILVVDRNQAMIRIVGSLLKQLNFHDVDYAGGGADAFAKLKERKYGLVLCDLNTDLVSGFDLLTHVRADEMLKDVPLIVMTDPSNAEGLNLAKRAGVNTTIL